MLSSEAPQVQAPTVDEFGKIEVFGIDIIPDDARHGTPKELFWPWFSANSTFINMITGGVLILLGLNIWQGLAAVLVGNAVFVLVGVCSLPGPRAGTATLTISRAAFGLRGNAVPTAFSWFATLGWETINIILGTLALRTLLHQLGMSTPRWALAPFLIVMALLTFAIPILGHSTLVVAQKWLAYLLTALTCVMAVILVPKVDWHYSGGQLAASNTLATWFLGLTAVLGAGAISWVNYGSDYSRYLRRETPAAPIIGWVTLATVLPGILYGGLGVVIGTLVDTSDPIKNLPSVLPGWFLLPFLLVVIAGVIANNVMNSYSSGLSLLALGIKVERYKSVFIDAVIAVSAALVALFVYDFSTVFTQFLSLLVILLAPWSGVFVVDFLLRRGRYASDDLLLARGGSYWYSGGIGWPALTALGIGVLGGVLVANTSQFQGPIAMNLLGGADLSPVVGLLLGAGVYYALASSRVTTAASA
ncbi:MAG: nucleobase:cation symporter, family [Nocardioidaceae bacterium]|jgi:NCS1 nucleoside transporter family|nr:nucleobase:cation symporter, family [Nocardioidaceae bacterium]